MSLGMSINCQYCTLLDSEKQPGWHWEGHFCLFGVSGVRNKQSPIVGPPFPVFEVRFSATAGWHSRKTVFTNWRMWSEMKGFEFGDTGMLVCV